MRPMRSTGFAVAALLVATALPATAQRMSLAERVDQLEQQAAQGKAGSAVELVNRLSELEAQIGALQGQVEELRHQLEQTQQRNRDQYVDLDSRLGRLEGSASTPTAPPSPTRPEQPPDIELGNPTAASGAVTPPPAATSPAGATDAPPRADGNSPEAYNQALAALKEGRYAEASRRFRDFIDTYPADPLAANAWYWLGESYYVTQNFDIAEEAFRTLLTSFPASQKAPDALLKIGYCQYELRKWSEAETTLTRVVETWPDTEAARLAERRLRALRTESRR